MGWVYAYVCDSIHPIHGIYFAYSTIKNHFQKGIQPNISVSFVFAASIRLGEKTYEFYEKVMSEKTKDSSGNHC